MAEWKFVEKLPNMKSREAMQGEFFANSSIDDETHALVREAIQNSLDAKIKGADGPVRVRFKVAGSKPASKETMSRYIDGEAWKHFSANGNGLEAPSPKNKECNYLVYEDFNTTGLEGDITQSEMEEGVDNPFYFFMRAEGQSGKSDDDRGRWGVGKFVFPYSSAIRSLFALTVRHSDGHRYLAGQCILKSHKVGGQSFTPDGWFGEFQGEFDFQLPTNSDEIVDRFTKDFGLDRKRNETGLSVMVPYTSPELSFNRIAKNVINEYFFPILRGHLVVTVCDNDSALLIDEAYLQGDTESDVFELQADTLHMLNLAKKVLAVDAEEHISLEIPGSPGAPAWNNDRVTADLATEIRRAIAADSKMASIRVPLYVREKQKSAVKSYFDIYLLKDESAESSVPLFVREGIRIPEARSRQIRGYRALVNIEHGAIANMLGDAENPAHTEWEKTSSKYKNKYDWGPSTIDFMRSSVAKLLQLLSQNDDEEDRNVLADIFFIDLPDNDDDIPDGARKKRKKKPGGKDIDPPPPIPKPAKRYYRLSKSSGGFTVRGPEEKLDTPREYSVRVAYDRSRGNPFKKYLITDFDISKSPIGVAGLKTDDLSESENRIRFRSDDGVFKLQVTGFDPNRDLIVDVQSKELIDEAI